jgi:hypothetical protein
MSCPHDRTDRCRVSIWSTPNKRIKAFETAVPGARVVEIHRVPLPPPQQADEPGPRVGPKLRTFMTGPVDRRGSHSRPHDPVEGSMVTGGTGLAAVFIVTEMRAQA